ncbi:uncharacterized protein FIBRA_00398 [Fibroporia radiculosa]|uniref:RING-type E3 ubiquitin transferase n=1 Tax=Fibroporia radiculosa TaxID=599839 RepID=J4G064_9APHY|nr:uncharacterized protein FIBRA_00398 [Fibroporia radiculosa]CCL98403.1 predicted protein [Fibroporia radiculosa]
MPFELPSFPPAQQAQIIRSNQRDFIHLSALREQLDGVLRTWLGTRRLTRWDREVELATKLLYYGMTVGRATQTLGEEYTDIWSHSSRTGQLPSLRTRAALILLPTLPSYVMARWGSSFSSTSTIGSLLRKLPDCLEVLSEVNLAVFYFRGTYYDLVKRVLRLRYVSSLPANPNTRPPSYSLLGILLATRLIYRLWNLCRTLSHTEAKDHNSLRGKDPAGHAEEAYIDDKPVSTMLSRVDSDEAPEILAENDERTVLDFAQISSQLRANRNCTLCLEERTATTATECGHLFCWDCIVGWGREKPECPLCRQSLSLTSLLPIYNL